MPEHVQLSENLRSAADAVLPFRKVDPRMREPYGEPVTTMDKALAAVRLLAAADKPLGLMEIVNGLGMPKPTVRRLLLGLMAQKFVIQEEDSLYELGNGYMNLASTALHQQTLAQLTSPVIADLRSMTSGTIMVSRLSGSSLRHQVQTPLSDKGYQATPPVDAPLYATAPGKAVLSRLPDPDVKRLASEPFERFTESTVDSSTRLAEELGMIRSRGYAVEDQEFQAGVRAVSAPIVSFVGRSIGAITVVVPAQVMSMAELHRTARYVAQAAEDVTKSIGGARTGEGR